MSNVPILVNKRIFDHIASNNPERTVYDKPEISINFPGFIIIQKVEKYTDVKLHPTEEKYPEQTRRFREILDEMYQTHLDKNADYSSWNINATGIVGLTVRFWDKCARIMNLIGFDIGTGEYTGAKKNLVVDESVIDTFKDAGVYSIIARVWAEGKWGK